LLVLGLIEIILIILITNTMSIKRVWVEEDCISCGSCESICPDVFEVIDISEVKQGVVFADFDAGIRDAADNCPVSVIKFEE
jgi:ferredoxin